MSIPYMVLGRPFLYRVLIMTHACQHSKGTVVMPGRTDPMGSYQVAKFVTSDFKEKQKMRFKQKRWRRNPVGLAKLWFSCWPDMTRVLAQVLSKTPVVHMGSQNRVQSNLG